MIHVVSKESTHPGTGSDAAVLYLSLYAVSPLGRTRGEHRDEQARKQQQYKKWKMLSLTD
jgi:hypothetical protein